jgi:hypothetical protein
VLRQCWNKLPLGEMKKIGCEKHLNCRDWPVPSSRSLLLPFKEALLQLLLRRLMLLLLPGARSLHRRNLQQ